MIIDPRPLEPAFVPGDVRHRDGEVDALSSALNPLIRGRHTDPVLLTGPSGTGKTCIARHVGDRLREESDAVVQYVNCWEDYSRFKTLYRLLEGIGRAYDIHRQSTPGDALLDRLRENLDAPYVAILDEVDQLEDKEVLYALRRTDGLSLVLIANAEEELYAPLEERIASRLNTARRIQFDRYGVDELVAILEDRVRWGLRESAVTHDQLRWVADAAAGDARVAIGSLRMAAEVADDEGVSRISDAMLREAAPEARAEIRQQSLEKLTPHQRVVYDLIEEANGIRPDALREAYCEAVDDPRSERTLRNYLRKMRRYSLVTAKGEGKARSYRVVE
jgi:orc1/cdc6 family replication initiation protein